jgi:hypothetical protein
MVGCPRSALEYLHGGERRRMLGGASSISVLVVGLVLWPQSFSLSVMEARKKRVPACWYLDLDD